MKKRLFIGVLSSALFLTACGSETELAPRKNLDKDMIANNSKNFVAPVDKTSRCKVTNSVTNTFEPNQIESDSYISKGLLVTRNELNYIGFYNLFTNKKITNNCFEQPYTTYNVESDINVGFVIKINYKKTYFVFDALGNKLYEGEENVSFESTKVNDEVYMTIIKENDLIIYKYGTSSLSVVSYIPTPLPEPEELVEEEDVVKFNFNDPYVDVNKIKLDDFGHTGYYLSSSSNMLTVFDNSNSALRSITIPGNCNYGVLGDYLIFQQKNITAPFGDEYTFIDQGQKYAASTYSVNYMTGERKNLETKYVFNTLTPLRDNNGFYSIGLMDLDVIDSNKVLLKGYSYIIDDKLKFTQDVTGESLSSFLKLPSGYFYNTSTKILYDPSLNIKSYLSGINPTMDKKNKLFWGTYSGNIGAVDFTGKVVIPFDYKNRVSPIDEKYVLLEKTNGIYRYNLNNGNVNFVGTEYEGINDYLYRFESDNLNHFEYVTPTTNLLSVSFTNSFNFSRNYFEPCLDDAYYLVDVYRESVEDGYRYTFVTIAGSQMRTYSDNPYGYEGTEPYHSGDTPDDAHILTLGTNLIKYNYFIDAYIGYYAYSNDSDADLIIDVTIPENAEFENIREKSLVDEDAYWYTGHVLSYFEKTCRIQVAAKTVVAIQVFLDEPYNKDAVHTMVVSEYVQGLTPEDPILLSGEIKSISLNPYQTKYFEYRDPSTYYYYNLSYLPSSVTIYDEQSGMISDGVFKPTNFKIAFSLYSSENLQTTIKLERTSLSVSYPLKKITSEDKLDTFKNSSINYYFKNNSAFSVTRYFSFDSLNFDTGAYLIDEERGCISAFNAYNQVVQIGSGRLFVLTNESNYEYIHSLQLSSNPISRKFEHNYNGFNLNSDGSFISSSSSYGSFYFTFKACKSVQLTLNLSWNLYNPGMNDEAGVKLNGSSYYDIVDSSGSDSLTFTLSTGDIVSVVYDKSYYSGSGNYLSFSWRAL